VIDLYESSYPDVKVVLLQDASEFRGRMCKPNPPDSFQTHLGAELYYTWVEPGCVASNTQLWTDEGWLAQFPSDLMDTLTFGGEIYGVPLGIHRGNVLCYNTQVFADEGLAAPSTIAEFLSAAETLQQAGVTPLAFSSADAWAATHVAETVLLGSMGVEEYRGLWDGTTPFKGAEVETALEDFDRMLDYANADHASVTWIQAVDRVADGQAAMTIMGDWMVGYLQARGLTVGVDIGCVPSPGSSGAFMVIYDGFALPDGVPHPTEAANWLKVLGSKEGQDTFNPIKGSIPARIDADPSLYGAYQQAAMADYRRDDLTPSMVHGMAAPPDFVSASHAIVSDFVTSRDVAGTAQAWQQAACMAGFGKCYSYLPMVIRGR
jgi:glucose/mannose transport system substrate-binding protein